MKNTCPKITTSRKKGKHITDSERQIGAVSDLQEEGSRGFMHSLKPQEGSLKNGYRTSNKPQALACIRLMAALADSIRAEFIL